MWLRTNYRYMMGLIVFAAFLYMVVLNIQSIMGIANSFYEAIFPLIIGVFVAFILDIIVYRYEKYLFPKTKILFLKKIRRPLCTILGLISVAFIISFVMYMAIPQTIHSVILAISGLPELYAKSLVWFENFSERYPFIHQALVSKNLTGQEAINQITTYGTRWATNLIYAFGNILSFFINLVIGFIFSIYLLLNKKQIIHECNEFAEAYFSNQYKNRTTYLLTVVNETFSSFFIGQFLDALTLGSMVGITMMVFKIPYALNIGCVIGLTALVPLLGAYIGATIGVVMLLVENPMYAVAFLAILLVMQQIENNFIYPKIVGNSIGLPGIWVFASIIVGGNLYGVVGMLLSVPLSATIYKLLRTDVQKRLQKDRI